MAGVSAATVSRVLSRPDMVAPTTREAVAAALSATGYRVNQAARNLRRQRTGAVVAMVPNLGNPFFAKILSGMGCALGQRGYDLLVGDTRHEDGRNAVLNRFLDPSRADGIILLDGAVTVEDLTGCPDRPPLVMACEWIEGADLPSVTLDNARGTELAARHLADLDHRRVGVIGGPPGNVLHRARMEGIARVFAADVTTLFPGDFTLEAGSRAADLWRALPRDRQPTGIVAFSDEMACGFLSDLARHGGTVPRDVSVVGFDDIELAAHLTPPLTTVRQPKRELGRRAAEAVLALIEGQPLTGRIALQPELVVRASTDRPRG